MNRWLKSAAAALLCLMLIVAAGFAIRYRIRMDTQQSTPVYGAIFVKAQGGAHELRA